MLLEPETVCEAVLDDDCVPELETDEEPVSDCVTELELDSVPD